MDDLGAKHWVQRDNSAGRRRIRIALGAILIGAGVLSVWLTCRLWFPASPEAAPPSDDPRVNYRGRFQNIHPDVEYVGDDRCSQCHPDIVDSFRRHPMGRSLKPIGDVAGEPPLNQVHGNPFVALGSTFRVIRDGRHVLHRRTPQGLEENPGYQLDFAVDYAIGSGTLGHSYLSNRNGFLFQTPISWYAQKRTWDLSPGFEEGVLAGRAVVHTCVFCHANRAHPREGTVNGYDPPYFDGDAIGCERCHGPAGRHVANPGRDPSDGVDSTIVNPRHLEPNLRMAVCEQCHLEGEYRTLRRQRALYDFRPGMPLEQFWSVFMAPEETGEAQAVSHVDQLYGSRCFRESRDDPANDKQKMDCVSCHDPHKVVEPEQRVRHYRGACLKCHAERSCTEEDRIRQSKNDSCIDCHMPRYSAADIPHTASTDHRIPRRPAPRDPKRPQVESALPLIAFYGDRFPPNDPGQKRDLGVALANSASEGKLHPNRYSGRAIALLEIALSNHSDDLDAWEAKAYALESQGRLAEALASFTTVLDKNSKRERSLAGAALLAQKQDQLEPAITYWRRALEINPWSTMYRKNLAQLLASKKDWKQTRFQCDAWISLDPAGVDARLLLAICMSKMGDKADARAELERIERMQPPNLKELRARFEEESREH